jgi:hypothetical protein
MKALTTWSETNAQVGAAVLVVSIGNNLDYLLLSDEMWRLPVPAMNMTCDPLAVATCVQVNLAYHPVVALQAVIDSRVDLLGQAARATALPHIIGVLPQNEAWRVAHFVDGASGLFLRV